MQYKPMQGTKQWFQKAYDESSPEIDPWGVSIRAGLQLRLDHYMEFIERHVSVNKLLPWEKTLDLGCALGDFSERLFRKNFSKMNIGSDLSLTALNNAKHRFGFLDFCVMVLPDLPFPKQRLDFISCISVLFYPQPDEQILFIKEMERVLKPGGYIFLEVPVGKSFHLSPNRLLELTSDSFDIIETGFFYGKHFLYLEGFLFRIVRKAGRLGGHSGFIGAFWRGVANLGKSFLKMQYLAKASLKLSNRFKYGLSHAYLLGRKRYDK